METKFWCDYCRKVSQLIGGIKLECQSTVSKHAPILSYNMIPGDKFGAFLDCLHLRCLSIIQCWYLPYSDNYLPLCMYISIFSIAYSYLQMYMTVDHDSIQ